MKQSNSGFTLLELMVGVAILAILLTIGLPSFINLFTNARVRATNDSVIEALGYARNQAVSQHREITLCAVRPMVIIVTVLQILRGEITAGWLKKQTQLETMRY